MRPALCALRRERPLGEREREKRTGAAVAGGGRYQNPGWYVDTTMTSRTLFTFSNGKTT